MARSWATRRRKTLIGVALSLGTLGFIHPAALLAATTPSAHVANAPTQISSIEVEEAEQATGSAVPQLPLQPTQRRPTSDELRIPNISAELGVGLLALPNAKVCVQRVTAGCARGDQSLELNAWPLFRATRDWSFGAGLTFALFPGTEAPRIDPEGIPRSHSRQYFLAEGTARYYPISEAEFELWLGPTVGLVVVSDTFTSQVDKPDLVQVGPTTGVNLVTEGATLGAAVGVSFAFSRYGKLGLYARGQSWFLPETPATSPTLDEASLTDKIAVLDFGVSIGFTTSRY